MKTTEERLSLSLENNRSELITTLQKLISFPSLFGHEEEAQIYYSKKLRDIGGEVDIWEPDIEELRKHPAFVSSRENFNGSPVVVSKFKGSGGGKSMLLCGHMDVVPPGKGKWTVDPWSGVLKDNKIYGRGAADMKGGIAANYIAMKSIIDSGIKLKGDVIIATTIDEECGSTGALSIALKGYSADGGIIPEPSALELYTASMGAIWFRVKVPGKSAHGGMAFEGENAIYKAMLIIDKLRELEEKRRIRLINPLYLEKPIAFCLNVNKITAGDWPAIVPAEAVFEGRMGVSPDESIEDAKNELEGVIKAISNSDDWLKDNPPVVEYLDSRWNSGSVDSDSPIANLIIENSEKILGVPAKITGMGAASDSGTFIRYANTPTINYGPNSLEIAHKTDEYVDVESLFNVAKVIAFSLVDWCGID